MAAEEGIPICYSLMLLNFLTIVTIIMLMMKLFDLFLTKHDQMVEKLRFLSYPLPYGQSSLPRHTNNSSVNTSSALMASSSSMLTTSPHARAEVGFDNRGPVPVTYWPKLSAISPAISPSARNAYGYRAASVVGQDDWMRRVGSSLEIPREESTNRRALNGERYQRMYPKRYQKSGSVIVKRVKKVLANPDCSRKPDIPIMCKGIPEIDHMDKLLKQITKFKEVTMSRINEMTSTKEAKKGNESKSRYKSGRRFDRLNLASKYNDYNRYSLNVEGESPNSNADSQVRKPRHIPKAGIPQRTLNDIMRDYGFSSDPQTEDNFRDHQSLPTEGGALGFFKQKSSKTSFGGSGPYIFTRNVGVDTRDMAETNDFTRSGIDQYSQVSKYDPNSIYSAHFNPIKEIKFTQQNISETPTEVHEANIWPKSYDQLSNKFHSASGLFEDLSKANMKLHLDHARWLSCEAANDSATELLQQDQAAASRAASNSSSLIDICSAHSVGVQEDVSGRMSPGELLKIIRLHCSSVEESKSYDDALRLFRVEKERLQKLDAIISSTSLRQSESNSKGEEGLGCSVALSEGQESRSHSVPNLSNNHRCETGYGNLAVNKSESAPPGILYSSPLTFPEYGLISRDNLHADMGYGDSNGLCDQSQGQQPSCNDTSPQGKSVPMVGRSYKVRHVYRVGYAVNSRLHWGKSKMKRRRAAASTGLNVGSRPGSQSLK